MKDWKKVVNKQNIKHFSWPSGWDSAETIATQLECSPERVRDILMPSIRAGEVEIKQFPIWDQDLQRKTMKTGFRQVTPRTIAEAAANIGIEDGAAVSPARPTLVRPRAGTHPSGLVIRSSPAKDFVGQKVTRRRGNTGLVGKVISADEKVLTIRWNDGQKTQYSTLSLRKGDFKLV